jgi:hypothetical protein
MLLARRVSRGAFLDGYFRQHEPLVRRHKVSLEIPIEKVRSRMIISLEIKYTIAKVSTNILPLS